MNIQEIIEYADRLEPNNFGDELKYQWINDVEDCIQERILGIRSEARVKYVCDENGSDAQAQPIADKNFGHGVYTSYIRAMLLSAKGDSDGYEALYKSFYAELNSIAKKYISAYNRRTRDIISAYIDSRLLKLFGDAVISGRLTVQTARNCIKVSDGQLPIFDIVRSGSFYTATSPEHSYNITGTPFKLAVNGENCQIVCSIVRGSETQTFTGNQDVYLGDVVTWTATPDSGYAIEGDTSGSINVTGNTVINVTAYSTEYGFTYYLNGLTLVYSTNVFAGRPFTAIIAAEEGHSMPEYILVTVGGTATDRFSYNSQTGLLSIDGEYVTGDIHLIAYGWDLTSVNSPLSTPYAQNGEGAGE